MGEGHQEHVAAQPAIPGLAVAHLAHPREGVFEQRPYRRGGAVVRWLLRGQFGLAPARPLLAGANGRLLDDRRVHQGTFVQHTSPCPATDPEPCRSITKPPCRGSRSSAPLQRHREKMARELFRGPT